MSTAPVLCHELKNGLTMMFVDESRKITTDRWYICIRVKINIPVEKKWFINSAMDDRQFKQIVDILGKDFVFSQKKERNFISDDGKEQVIKDICEGALIVGETYYSRDDFASKMILKKFKEQQRH